MGSLQRLPNKIANDSLLRELALTARSFGAQEAQTLGLVSKVVEGGRVEVLAAAMELAAVIASKSPIATLGTKHLLNYSRDHTVQEGLNYTTVWNMSMLQSEDLSAAFAAYAPPSFYSCLHRQQLTSSFFSDSFATKKPASFGKLGKL